MDDLLDAELNLCAICRLADDVAALISEADSDVAARLARIKRDAEAIRLRIPATMAAA